MQIDRFNFPGGEVHVKLSEPLPTYSSTTVRSLTHFIRNSDDIMALLLITDAMRRSGQKNIALTLPYVPYSRQDRVMVEGEPLSLKVFADLINAQNYESVTIWDPHSDVTPALINNCTVIEQATLVYNNMGVILHNSRDPILVCPDAGARKKILKVAKYCGISEVIWADKIRDVKTGKITGTTLGSSFPTPETDGRRGPVYTRDFFIVDDIIDGGATFIEIAKHLRSMTSGKIKLYATHGIFSKGLGVFDGLIDEIYTANCWLSPKEVAEQTNGTKLHLGIIAP